HEGCTHVAMESTGVYWKPVYNILEGQFELLVVNAQHLKAVPGRKTDVRDRARTINRLQKVLETANIKLANVVSDIDGTVSSQGFRFAAIPVEIGRASCRE